MRCFFFFDYLSPYSYIAWRRFQKLGLNNIKTISIEYVPVVLSRIIHAYETKGPAEIESKRDYLFKHCLRYSKEEEIPFQTPAKLPFNSLDLLRLSTIFLDQSKKEKLIDLIFSLGWSEGKDLENYDLVYGRIQEELPRDAAAIIDFASNKESRKKLKDNQKFALEHGVFGLPSFLMEANNHFELFWGNDSLDHLRQFIQNTDTLDQAKFNLFKKMHF